MIKKNKFAFWHKKRKEMWSVESINWQTKEVSNGGDVASLDDGDLLQFTGLLDINGKEIFEGDIVRFWANPKDYGGYKGHDYIASVEWDEFSVGFILSDGHGLGDFEFLQVVGNIYQNPELLGGKND